MTDKSSQNSTLLGQYMLKGWTMLADNCPNPTNDRYCTVPLLGNRNTGVIMCVNCNTHFKRTPKGNVVPEEDTPPEKKLENKPSPKLAPKKEAPNANAPKRQFQMAAQEDEEDEESFPDMTDDSRPSELGHLQDENDDFAAEHEFKPQDLEQKMKEKRSQGWNKISEQCPKCFVPLFQDPDSRVMTCVSCDSQVISQKDFDPKKHRVVGKIGNFEKTLAEEVEVDDDHQAEPEADETDSRTQYTDDVIPPQQGKPAAFLQPYFQPFQLQPPHPQHPQQPHPQQPQHPHPQQPTSNQQANAQHIPSQQPHPLSPQHAIKPFEEENYIKNRLHYALNNQLKQAEHILNNTPLNGNQNQINSTLNTVSEILNVLRQMKN